MYFVCALSAVFVFVVWSPGATMGNAPLLPDIKSLFKAHPHELYRRAMKFTSDDIYNMGIKWVNVMWSKIDFFTTFIVRNKTHLDLRSVPRNLRFSWQLRRRSWTRAWTLSQEDQERRDGQWCKSPLNFNFVFVDLEMVNLGISNVHFIYLAPKQLCVALKKYQIILQLC